MAKNKVSERDIFIHELRRITGVSEQYATAAWLSISSPARLSPEKQAGIYANLYGLVKPKTEGLQR